MSLRPWNDVLVKGPTSRYPLRIKTYGFEQSGPGLNFQIFAGPKINGMLIALKQRNWKQVKTIKVFIEKRKDYSPSPPSEHRYQSVSLEEEFRKDGLQVIVRISSIELTPENPWYQGDDDFHIDGLLNEHIVATSRYYYDADNVTEGRISFPQEDYIDTFEYRLSTDAMYKVFGLPVVKDNEGQTLWALGLQTLGSVVTHQGRFLAWPNTLRHKTQPFVLEDATRPGHQRYITLFLVDPHYRICSSRNVPAQQHEWWRESALASTESLRGLPQELADLVMDETGDWPIGITEAERWKNELETERERAKEWQTRAVQHHDFESPIFSGEEGIIIHPSK
ncbi:unnamed protein product [Penicillium glandicola]